ncbi:MAG: hypothetical protein WCB68_11875 [Pyrinomonadaceae bacterium]
MDPLTAAQNSRIKFQTGGETLSSMPGGVSEAETALTEAVLEKDRQTSGDHLHLLYTGNSQTLAIMDRQPGDLTTPQWLEVLLSRRSHQNAPPTDVILGSLPNMTNAEVLIKLVAAGERSPRQVDVLLGAAILEEYRGLGVREEVSTLLNAPNVKDKLLSLMAGNQDLTAARDSLNPLVNSTTPAAATASAESSGQTDSSYAQTFEKHLQTAVERVPVFARRQDLQAEIYTVYHLSRNRLLGINSSTARPVPGPPYRANLELLELMMRYAQSKGIHTAFYLSPIRPIQPNPNLASDVTRFRRDVLALCRRYNTPCFDYTDLVPENLWTNYSDSDLGASGQRDFAHFTGKAHKLVAERLLTDLGAQLDKWAEERRTLQP